MGISCVSEETLNTGFSKIIGVELSWNWKILGSYQVYNTDFRNLEM